MQHSGEPTVRTRLSYTVLTTYILKSYQEQLPSAKMMFIENEVLKCSKSLCLLFYVQQQHQMVFRLEWRNVFYVCLSLIGENINLWLG